MRISQVKKAIVPLLCAFFLCKGQTDSGVFGRDRAAENVFTDIFYIYYGDEKSRARDMLKRAIRDPRLKSRALINLGVIDEWEKRYDDSEERFRRALDEDEPLALPYLLAAYDGRDRSKRNALLRSLRSQDAVRWACFELALVHCDAGETDLALKSLDLAAAAGFDAPSMLLNEPRLAPLRSARRFREILSAAQRNAPGKSLVKRAGQSEQAMREKKPYGCSKALYEIDEIRKKGAPDDAARRLTAFTGQRISFRDKSVALYWLARFRAQRGDLKGSKGFLAEFDSHLHSGEADPTGYKQIMSVIYLDLIRNDPVLRAVQY